MSGSESVRFRECNGVESKRGKLTCHLQQSLTGHLGVDDVMALSERPLRWYCIIFFVPLVSAEDENNEIISNTSITGD